MIELAHLPALALAIALTTTNPTHAQHEGEDIASPRSENPLRRIEHQMRLAQQQIANHDTSEGTQSLQQQAIHELTELIRQTAKKCSGAGQRPSEKQKPSSGAGAGKKPSSRPAQDSVTRLGQTAADPNSPDLVRQLNRKAWGLLPPGLRRPMLNADFEAFLPKYERLIERYFERLAEETDTP